MRRDGVGCEHRTGVYIAADHPFVYLIRDRLTGAILFMGRLSDPS